MYAIEFQTRVSSGIIEIPDEYKEKVSGQVRVILLAQDKPSGEDLIAQLLASPLSLDHFEPLTRDEIHERL
jgi:hypothetical protein